MSKSTKKIWEVILFMSSRACIILVIICALSGVLLANEGHSQSLNKVKVSLELRNSYLVDILSSIEGQTKFQFSYTDEIKSIAGLTIHAKNKQLSDVLRELENNADVSFRQFNQMIAVSKKENFNSEAIEKKISGKVTDKQTSEPLPGVSILIKGTASGTTTDTQGEFALNVQDEHATLVLSFIGYETQEIPVGNQTFLTVELLQNSSTLQEVVVIGYGEQARAKVTGAVSQVKSKDLANSNGSSFAIQLSGKAAGVIVNEASAQPGTDPQVVIRGIGTLTAGRNPLVVVDGFPLSEGSSLNSINPQDIASVDILKDPASAAIYGSRAANGVILITTKKSKTDKLSISFDAYTGIQQRADGMEFPDAYQSAQFFTEARDWGYVSKDQANRSIADDRATRITKGASLRELRLNYIQPYLDNEPGLVNTNWLDEIFRDAKMSSYNLALSGGSSKTNYYVSGNYFNQEGIVMGTGLKRYSGTIKIDSKLSDRFDFGVMLAPSYQRQDYFENDSDRSYDPISIALTMYPFFSAYNPDGSLSISQQIISNTPEDGALSESSVAIMKKVKHQRNTFRTFGNTFLSMELMKGLKFKTMLGADVRDTFFDYYNPSDVGQYRGAAPKPAIARETNGTILNYLSENTLNYSREFGIHSVDALAGYTFQKESSSATVITGSGIADDNITNIAGASAFTVAPTRYKWTQISYLARIQYSILDRYLISLATRADGSSRFGKDTKWGNFPSVTAGWIISEESFFPKTNAINFAKLRASWGKAGNNQIGSYSSQALVGSSNYVYGNTVGAGFAANTTPNPNLSWETKISTNVGLDLTFLESFNFTADYYTTTTEDLLLNVPIPEQSGYSASIQNIGKVKNSGIELEISGNGIKLGPILWGFSGNFSKNKNEVLALAAGQEQIITGVNSSFRTKVGGPVAELYGYNVIGVYKTQDEINGTPHLTGTIMGDYIVEDITGDGQINQEDKKGFGTYLPKFTYGFSSNFVFKNFDLNFSVVGVEGRKIFDNALINAENGEGFSMPTQYYFDNRYHPENNPDGFFAQPNMGNFSSARRETRGANVHFADADYFRLRNIQVGYTLPVKTISKAGLTSVRIYASANNLFTLSEFRGFNPEATTDNVLTSGYSYSNYPVARSFVFGANLTF